MPFDRVEDIFHRALEHEPAARRAYVEQSCAGDAALLHDVLSLLATADEAHGDDAWASDAAARLMASETSLQPGQMLGPYRVESFLASGGMGEVYVATDTRLNRKVAIKVSAAAFSERFEREATVIASLNHPHICQLHDVGTNYLVMELVEGTPLRGPLPLSQALEYAAQILDALNAAHQNGIVHRDLKPQNILVTKRGIKLLDFGLAEQREFVQDADMTRSMPAQGAEIAGTLRYMAPEQLRGSRTDARTDIFGFGCVVYEMLSGRRPFDGSTAADTIAAILEREPEPLDTVSPVRRVVDTCLTKNPERRFQNALDVKLALSWAVEQPPSAAPARRASWWVGAAALMIAIGVGAAWALSRAPRSTAGQTIRFQIPLAAGETSAPRTLRDLAVSPDGLSIAFIATGQGHPAIWMRALDAESAHLLPGTENATRLLWSPDGASIAFSTASALERIDLSRLAVTRICDVDGTFNGGAWLPDGSIVFANRNVGMFRVAAIGGVPAPVALIDSSRGDVTYANPHSLPDGRLLYTVQSPQSVDVYAATVTKPFERTRVATDATNAWLAHAAAGTDDLLWLSGQSLYAQPFDAAALHVTGERRVLADQADLAASGGGTLLYAPSLGARQFEWVDRQGKVIGPLGPRNPFVFGRVSPDGRHVATIRAGANADIWVLDSDRNVGSRLTTGHGVHIGPVWSPDGRTLLFGFGAPFNIFRIRTDGSGTEERVTQSATNQYVSDWSSNGRVVIYDQAADATGLDLWTLEVTPDGKPAPGASPRPYIRAPFDQQAARFSPDGRWVAYESNDSGQWESYVQAFPEPRDRFAVSVGGGRQPMWSADGRELYYVSKDGTLMSVALEFAGASVKASVPRHLFLLHAPSDISLYDAAPDGRRFLTSTAAGGAPSVDVIVNWAALVQ